MASLSPAAFSNAKYSPAGEWVTIQEAASEQPQACPPTPGSSPPGSPIADQPVAGKEFPAKGEVQDLNAAYELQYKFFSAEEHEDHRSKNYENSRLGQIRTRLSEDEFGLSEINHDISAAVEKLGSRSVFLDLFRSAPSWLARGWVLVWKTKRPKEGEPKVTVTLLDPEQFSSEVVAIAQWPEQQKDRAALITGRVAQWKAMGLPKNIIDRILKQLPDVPELTLCQASDAEITFKDYRFTKWWAEDTTTKFFGMVVPHGGTKKKSAPNKQLKFQSGPKGFAELVQPWNVSMCKAFVNKVSELQSILPKDDDTVEIKDTRAKWQFLLDNMNPHLAEKQAAEDEAAKDKAEKEAKKAEKEAKKADNQTGRKRTAYGLVKSPASAPTKAAKAPKKNAKKDLVSSLFKQRNAIVEAWLQKMRLANSLNMHMYLGSLVTMQIVEEVVTANYQNYLQATIYRDHCAALDRIKAEIAEKAGFEAAWNELPTGKAEHVQDLLDLVSQPMLEVASSLPSIADESQTIIVNRLLATGHTQAAAMEAVQNANSRNNPVNFHKSTDFATGKRNNTDKPKRQKVDSSKAMEVDDDAAAAAEAADKQSTMVELFGSDEENDDDANEDGILTPAGSDNDDNCDFNSLELRRHKACKMDGSLSD